VIALDALPLFAGLDETGLDRVRAVAVEIDVPAGQTLVRPGDPGAGLFVLQAGTAVVEARGDREIEVGAGEFVGELALLVPDSTRSARVRAKSDVRCVAIGGEDFRQLLENEPRIALAMLPVVAERLWRVRQG
jgi:CRP/FNR family transcriptional regulator, cyclic AMP receptor protein